MNSPMANGKEIKMNNSEKTAKEQAAFERTKEITDKLEAGLKALFDGDNYKSYLNTMSRFHNYSFNNTMLIALQKPDATLVAGFNSWQKNFKRNVNKGEKGIKIFAPAPYTIKKEQTKLDKDTQLPVLDKDGKPITEEVEVKIPAFKVVSVFDVSQTNGKELPQLGADELKGDVENFEKFFATLKEISPVPITFEKIESGAKGYYSQSDKDIHINEGMSDIQTIKTAIHEIAHSKLHDRDLKKSDIDEKPKDRNTEEVEAESIAYTVCQHFGIDTSDYSFAYVAAWGTSKETPELKASLETIRATSSEIITSISDKLRGLEQTRENTIAQEADKSEPKKNIIGNTAYSAIQDKQYFRLKSETAEKVAAQLTELKIPFSGRVGKDSTTITIGAKDVEAYKAIEAEITGAEKNVPNKPQADKSRNTVVINAFGGAGAGKTTACMHIAAELKKQGFVAEYVPEYAKELVWDKKFDMLDGSLDNQRRILSEQSRRMERLMGQVDFIITDSPILLNGVYLNDCPEKENYCKEILKEFKNYTNFNFVVKRDEAKFETEGRIHNLEQSKAIDGEVTQLLKDNNLYFGTYDHSHLETVVKNVIITHDKLAEASKKIQAKEKPKFDIVGNTAYKDIPEKFFIRISADKAVAVAAEFETSGVKYSGRMNGDKATLTISKSDVEVYKKISAELDKSPQDIILAEVRDSMVKLENAEKVFSQCEEEFLTAKAEYEVFKDIKDDDEAAPLRDEAQKKLKNAAEKLDVAIHNVEEYSGLVELNTSEFFMAEKSTAVSAEQTPPKVNHLDIPIVFGDFAQAREKGEEAVSALKNSNNENRSCSEAIAAAIDNASTYVEYGRRVNAQEALENVAKEYPLERIALVTAHQIVPSQEYLDNQHHIDGRYSKDVKAWAINKVTTTADYNFKNFEYCNYSDKSHPVIVDSFANKVIAMEKELEKAIDEAVVEDVEKSIFDELLVKTGFEQVTKDNAFAADGLIVIRSPEGKEQSFDGYTLATSYLENELQKDNVKVEQYDIVNIP